MGSGSLGPEYWRTSCCGRPASRMYAEGSLTMDGSPNAVQNLRRCRLREVAPVLGYAALWRAAKLPVDGVRVHHRVALAVRIMPMT